MEEAAVDRNVDVLMISDLRFSGGTSHSIAEEIGAQFEAGWTTGLTHLNGHLVARVTPVNPAIRDHVVAGRARLLIGKEPITSRIAVIRHPAVFERTAGQLPPIETRQVVLVANSTLIAPDGSVEFDARRVEELVRQRFGVSPLWAPLSPAIRGQLLRFVKSDALLADDWVNIIDPDQWYGDHNPPMGNRPVIGRHSRNVPAKWPTTLEELVAIYPVDGSVRVHVLGGAEPARTLLGRPLPESWRVEKFGARAPRDFLRELDAYVYYPDPRWIEAFGRNVLEAMATGVPVILPPRFESVFGDAANYAEPPEVQSLVRSLHQDRGLWHRTREHALADVKERFGHAVHRSRMAMLADLPLDELSAATAPVASGPTTVKSTGGDSTTGTAEPSRPRLLLISSNGSGMGHLMRLLAYARKATSFHPFVLSLSQAVGATGTFDIPYGYLPSANALGMAPRNWHPIFAERVGRVISELNPSVVVFDGTWPYAGIEWVRAEHPDPIWVWSRRGMWKISRSGEQLSKSSWFDEVLEPGDFAAAADIGPTVHEPAHRVPPVTIFDSDEIYSREEARELLGLPRDGGCVLVSLSGGPEADIEPDTREAIAAVRSLGMHICVTRSAISQRVQLPPDVHVINRSPLALYYRAFDASIAGAGYNSFHELLRYGVPAVFVPKGATALDDQARRARWASDQGWAHTMMGIDHRSAARALADLIGRRAEIVAKVAAADPGNGARSAADFFARLHESRVKR